MIRTKSVFFFAFLLSFSCFGQKLTYKGFPSLNWPILYSVEYKKVNTGQGESEIPLFNSRIKALNEKQLVLPGYMVPFENGLKGKEFMLSSLPLNACFFCGVGGPETVVYVKLRETATYSERPIEVKGILKLNESDPDQLMYTLENSEILGEIDF